MVWRKDANHVTLKLCRVSVTSHISRWPRRAPGPPLHLSLSSVHCAPGTIHPSTIHSLHPSPSSLGRPPIRHRLPRGFSPRTPSLHRLVRTLAQPSHILCTAHRLHQDSMVHPRLTHKSIRLITLHVLLSSPSRPHCAPTSTKRSRQLCLTLEYDYLLGTTH